MSVVDQVVSRLNAKGPRGGWYTACCPFHDDRTPSLGFTTNGFKCQGCGRHGHINALADHLGLKTGGTDGRLSAEEAERRMHNRGLRPETIERFRITPDVGRQAWRYPTSRSGTVRLKTFDGKPKYLWEGEAAGAEIYGLPGALEIDADHLFLVEGEPDVWIGQQAGLPCVSFTHGATAVPEAGVRALGASGASRITVVYDKDEAGEEGAAKASGALIEVGLQLDVRRLPDSFPPGSDLTDLYNSLKRDDERFREAVGLLAKVGVGSNFPAPVSLAALIAEPRVEADWLAEGVIPSGGNVLVAGYPKSNKTFFALEFAVSLASGTPFLGRFSVPKKRRVGVVLMEGIRWQAGRRLERICKAHDVDPRSLAEFVHVWHRPPLMLSDRATIDGLSRRATELGLDVLIVDAWAHVASGNSDRADEVTPQLASFSSIRDHVPGLTCILIHHARKKSETKDERVTDLIRGSSAFGAWYDCGVVLSRKDEESPVSTRVELRDYHTPRPFAFMVEDGVPANAGNGWCASGALRLIATDGSPADLAAEDRANKAMPEVRAFIEANPGCSKRKVRAGVPGSNPTIDQALSGLIDNDEVENRGSETHNKLYLNIVGAPVPSVPDSAPGTGGDKRAPVPLPRRGGARHAPQDSDTEVAEVREARLSEAAAEILGVNP